MVDFFLCVCHRNRFVSQVITRRSQNERDLERTVLRESNIQKIATAEIDPCVASLSCLANAVRRCLVN